MRPTRCNKGDLLLINSISTCFGHLYAPRQEIQLRSTVYSCLTCKRKFVWSVVLWRAELCGVIAISVYVYSVFIVRKWIGDRSSVGWVVWSGVWVSLGLSQIPQHPIPINPTWTLHHTGLPQRREAHFRIEPCWE